MYIKEATIYGFIPFDTFGIESINIDADSIIQILIGSNGSGKSALLRELNPLPAIKSMYHKNGGKELLILHKDSVFKISSTFGRNGKHSFIMNEQELNTDGTAPLQTELSERYLGYTPLVHNFILGKYDFTFLRPAERKSLLMSLSTAIPSFMIDMHKYTKSKLRDYKSNISLLYTRKQEIENKLDKDLIIKLKSEKEELEKLYISISFKIQYTEKMISDLESKTISNNNFDDEFIDTFFNKTIKEKKKDNIRFRIENSTLINEFIKNQALDFDEDNPINNLKLECTKLESRLNSILANGKETALAIENLNKNIDTLKNGEEISVILNDLEVKNKYLEELKTKLGDYVNSKPLNEEEMNLANNNKIKIFDELCLFLEDRDIGDFVTREELSKVKDNLNNIIISLKYMEGQILTLEKANKDLNERISKFPNEPLELTNSCETCEYRKAFKTNKDKYIKDLQENKEVLEKNYKDREELTKKKDLLLKEYEILSRNFEILNRAYAYINGSPYIFNKDNKSFLEVGNEIKKDICKYLSNIDYICCIQQDVIKYHELLKEISDINIKIKSMKESNLPNIQILEKLRDENKIKRMTLLKEYKDTEEKLNTVKRNISIFEEHKKRKLDTESDLKMMDNIRETYLNNKFLEHLKNEYLVGINNIKKEIDDKLFKINKELKEQESLQERYDKEVMVMIKELEERKEIYEYIEYSLSPETGLVHHNLIRFVNSLIKNVNFVISKIWTSKLEIVELKDTDEFNCVFYANCNGNIVKIENLSKGQTKVMNFAWYIALQIALDTKDYPVFFDECDENLDKKHKEKYIEWLKTYIDEGYASQMWLVNHDAALYTGFLYKDIICLNKDNIIAPSNSNRCTKIIYK